VNFQHSPTDSTIDRLENSQCENVKVIADDSVTKYVSDHAQTIGEKRIDFFYMPLASPDSWTQRVKRIL